MYNKKIRVAFLGKIGSNSFIAAKNYFPFNKLVGYATFSEIFLAITSGSVDYGIIPIENSLTGSIVENYDLLFRHHVFVIGEYFLRIENHLIGLPPKEKVNNHLTSIRAIFSHSQVFIQCNNFFKLHPWIKLEPTNDTSTAAKLVAEKKDVRYAAIGNSFIAKIFKLKIIRRDISDDPNNNITRFLIIGKRRYDFKEANRGLLIFTLSHRPGSLYSALEILARGKLNLLKIELRPLKHKPFEYLFYIDINWRKKKLSEIKKLLSDFSKHTLSCKLLGLFMSKKYD